ncbi:MAG: type I methionyl aminopeptidase [Mycoplasmoidaceae bacterium]
MIIVKSSFDIDRIRETCKIWKKIRSKFFEIVKEGISLKELDEIAKSIIIENGATASFFNYQKYKHNICTSVNEVVIHGVPNNYKLKNGDLISIDVGVTYNNYICDAAYTIIVGSNKDAEYISKVCYDSLIAGIKAIAPGARIGDISNSIYTVVEKAGFKILEDFTGHGCGKKLHEDPIIPNYGEKSTGMKLVPGMVLCIEPMIMTDSNHYFISKKDKWSVIAKNKKLTCHWEHMVLVTNSGYEILTE